MMTPQWTPPRLDPAVLNRIRGAAHEELAGQPKPRNWRLDVLLFLACTTAFTVCIALVLRFAGNWAVSSAAERPRTLSMLLVLQFLGAWAAIAPRARRAQLATIAFAMATMLALIFFRETGSVSPLPQWVCTVSHFGLALLPMVGALLLLRRAMLAPLRVLAAGVALGTIGAVIGELACGQDARHVALFHLPAWIGAAALTYVIGRRLRPQSFAS